MDHVLLITLLFLAAVLVPSPTHSAQNIDWNQVVDQLIDQFKTQINEKKLNVVPLPPFSADFERRFIITVRGQVNATGGRVGDMNTIERVGPVEVTESTISTLLRFSTLHIHYNHFQARVLSLNPSGHMNATVGENQFLLKLRLESDGSQCRFVFEDVQVMELANVKVKISGMKILNDLASVIASRAAKSMRQTIAVRLERLLYTELEGFFTETELDCS